MLFNPLLLLNIGIASVATLVSASATLQGSYKITPQDYYGLRKFINAIGNGV